VAFEEDDRTGKIFKKVAGYRDVAKQCSTCNRFQGVRPFEYSLYNA
jgi:hypothetical protein